jgi:uncharacterized membrane protein
MTLQKDLLEEHLDQWKAAGLIDDHQLAEISRYERQHGPGMELPTRRIPVIAEALGYLGAALAAAAVLFFAINQWKEWSDVTRVAVLGVATLAAFTAGWATRRSEEPAIRRFSTVLMTLTVGGTVGTTVLLCNDVLDMRDSYGAQTAGGVGLAVAFALYLLRRHMLLQLAMLGTLLLTLMPGFERLDYPTQQLWGGATLLALGAIWFVLGWRKVLEPDRGARIVGPIIALMGPTTMYDGSSERAWALVVGVLLAIAIVGLSVAFTQPELTFIGSIFTFQYLLIWLNETLKGTLAVPVALLVAGGLALGAALVLTRRMRGGPGTTS